MALILSIETATKVCSVALHRRGVLLGFQELFIEKSHSSLLVVMIEQLLSNCQVGMDDLDAIAVSKGPGSYTGLRIGVATAKGLCFAQEIPLLSVNTLESMVTQIKNLPLEADFLCPMLDARRMEVYCLVFDRALEKVSATKAVVVDADSFGEWLQKGKVLFFGNGAGKCEPVLQGPNSIFINDLHPTATSTGLVASSKFEQGAFEDLSYFEPFYLKEFRTTIPKNKALH